MIIACLPISLSSFIFLVYFSFFPPFLGGGGKRGGRRGKRNLSGLLRFGEDGTSNGSKVVQRVEDGFFSRLNDYGGP